VCSFRKQGGSQFALLCVRFLVGQCTSSEHAGVVCKSHPRADTDAWKMVALGAYGRKTVASKEGIFVGFLRCHTVTTSAISSSKCLLLVALHVVRTRGGDSFKTTIALHPLHADLWWATSSRVVAG
ncbi:MAG: hypothetical protein N2Z21_09510, partial [Candidatus Sumerlaeaceae bacterium]|nr:hypothetical protein [Candidatus Sumerlaeaceae bacterium]